MTREGAVAPYGSLLPLIVSASAALVLWQASADLSRVSLGWGLAAFVLMTLGDERAVRATYVLGELAYTPP